MQLESSYGERGDAHSLLFSKAARTAMMELVVFVVLLVAVRSSNVAVIGVVGGAWCLLMWFG